MTTISAKLVQELRERTGVAMGKCKEALVEAQGDMEQAIQILRKAGIAGAVKKEGRDTKDGAIGIGQSAQAVSLVEINCETDFVAKSDAFQEFLQQLCSEAAVKATASVEQLMDFASAKDPTLTNEQLRALLIQKLGENIRVRRVAVLRKGADRSIGVYSHMNGKIVCAVELEGASTEETLAREIAMHCAAEAPEFLQPEDVPPTVRAQEEEVARGQVKGKPEHMMAKIVEGKLNAYYDQVCLPRQKFVKDPSLTVGQVVEKRAKEIGQPLRIVRFYRWQVGV
ncbi:MAG: translation elongation factor Ts [Chlamydiia bacterium]